MIIKDDIMHVILKIRVPLLQVKAGYVLMGKVGDQVLRGNGQLNGNFSKLIKNKIISLPDITLILPHIYN